MTCGSFQSESEKNDPSLIIGLFVSGTKQVGVSLLKSGATDGSSTGTLLAEFGAVFDDCEQAS